MKLKFFGGSLDGQEIDHDSPGWETLYAAKVGREFYIIEKVTKTGNARLRYNEGQLLPAGKTARFIERRAA